ncbi:glycosyltransferase family 4 protein [Chelativorans sp. AA-79]|uniref:glycosyltransferase family 4 protein n=1 Tax=Chelativorans sp. AA-79 TaxID=3028735 RepID=UPI0023F9B745|nr:glycosyltransferase family 4 protein [Chelativorans sp. AA-79]WEX10221.1 glycosyltransferase family 4 protein [Chelativorans sp. AA-79]
MNLLRIPSGESAPVEHRRVLMTVDAVGGVWRYAMELARGLLAHNIGVVFAGLGPQPSSYQAEEAKRLGKVVWLDEPLDWIAPDETAVKGLPAKLARLARQQHADLLHLNLPSQAAGMDTELPVVVASHSCVVTWWHAMRNEPLPADWEWMKRQNAVGMDQAHAVVSPSGSHAQAISACYGEQPRLTVVHNAISAFLQGVEKEPFVFSAARWWDEGKNGRVLDEAAARMHWPVVMAGSTRGPNGQEITFSRVRCPGEIPHREVLDSIRRAGIVVSPSLYEPFGLAALEGARAGAALVLSDIPTYRELWSNAAIFFDPKDADALAHAVSRLASDSGLRAEMGAKALARSRRFTPDVQASRMAELYRQLVDEPMAA